MERNLQFIFQVLFVVLLFICISSSEDNDGGLQAKSGCPDEVQTLCFSQGRHACVGRENACGKCIEPYFKQVGGHCDRVGLADLPGEAVDDLLDSLDSKRKAKKDEEDKGNDPEVVIDPPSGKDESEKHPQNEERGEEYKAAAQEDVIARDVIPITHSGEIVLEEWQFMLIVGGCILFAVVGVAIAFYCCYRIQTASKDPDADYPSYGVTGPGAALNGDRKLAQSAQMYHYQHQKQQMIAMQKREKGEAAEDGSDFDSEEENEDGDLTVYECPGLAPTGEMQVKNPLFTEDQYTEPANVPDEEKP